MLVTQRTRDEGLVTFAQLLLELPTKVLSIIRTDLLLYAMDTGEWPGTAYQQADSEISNRITQGAGD